MFVKTLEEILEKCLSLSLALSLQYYVLCQKKNLAGFGPDQYQFFNCK